MRPLKILCLLTALGSFNASSQFVLKDFLSSSITDSEIQIFDEQKSLLSGKETTSPFIQEVDIRLRTNNFIASPEDLRFRLDIINPAEISANKKYQNQYTETLEARKISALNQILVRRYVQVAHHHYLTQLLAEEKNNLTYLRLLSGIEDAEIRDLLERDQDLLKAELEILKQTSEIEKLEMSIKSDFPFEGGISWENFSLITPGQMFGVLDLDSLYISPFVREAESEKSLAKKEFDYDVGRSKSSIGFIQPEMDISQGNDLGENIGFQFGFNLPIVNSDRARQQYEKIELLEENSRVAKIKSKTSLTRNQLESEFKSTLKALSLVLARLEQFESLRTNSVAELSDELAKIEYQRRLNVLVIDYKYSLLRIYLNLLMEQGRLAATPHINYLSALLDQF